MSASFQSLQNCNTKAPISWEQFNSSILKSKKKNCENDVNLKKISEVILPFSLHFLLPFVTFLWPISHLPIKISNHMSVIWCKWLCLCTQKKMVSWVATFLFLIKVNAQKLSFQLRRSNAFWEPKHFQILTIFAQNLWFIIWVHFDRKHTVAY